MGWRTNSKKYRLSKSQRPVGTVAGTTKRLASRFYQIKTGHCLTGQSLNWTKTRLTPKCWRCRYRMQTRGHLFKEYHAQQKFLWAEVKKETGRWKDRWKERDLLAEWRCSRGVLDFLATTDVCRRVQAEEDDAVSVVSEPEVREWLDEQGAGGEEAGAGGLHCYCPRLTSWRPHGRYGRFPLTLSFDFSFFISYETSLVRVTYILIQAWAEGKKGRLRRAATARTAVRKRIVHNLAVI